MSKSSSAQVGKITASGADPVRSAVLQRQHTLGVHHAIQRDATGLGVHENAPNLVRSVLNSPGRPLDASIRSSMEPHFGQDLSSVRVHTDDSAAESARAVSASAYTAGSHVVFGERQYSPGTMTGQRLLAHELTHVVQQAAGPVAGTPVSEGLSVSHHTDPYERAARATADRMPVPSDSAQFSGDTSHAPIAVNQDRIQIQRVDEPPPTSSQDFSAKRSADAGVASAVIGGLGVLASIGGLIIAGKTLAATRRQADAAEDPPIPQPTQGGLVSTHVDKIDEIKGEDPSSDDDETTVEDKDDTGKANSKTTIKKLKDGTQIIETTSDQKGHSTTTKKKVKPPEKPKPKEEEKGPFTILRIQEGAGSRADFNLSLRVKGPDITGGNTEDGDIVGYTGGSVAGNAGVTFKASPGVRVEGPRATVRIQFGGYNTPARMTLQGDDRGPTKTANAPQRFSGAIKFDASGERVGNPTLHVNPPGTGTKPAGPFGDGKTQPIVTVSLNSPDSAPGKKPD